MLKESLSDAVSGADRSSVASGGINRGQIPRNAPVGRRRLGLHKGDPRAVRAVVDGHV